MTKLIDDFYKNLLTEFEGRTRDNPYFHVSDLSRICPRAVFYSRKYNVPFRQKQKLARPVVLAFAYGIMIQKLLSRYSSYLISKYVCPRCGHVYYLSYGDWETIKCNKKYLFLDEYRVKLEAKGFKLVGHIDSLYTEHGKIYIAEIKSISSKQFEELKEPLFDHVFQVLTYLWMFNRKKVKMDEGLKRFKVERDRAYILYFKKDFQNFEVKKFMVKKNEYGLEERIKNLLVSLVNPDESSPRICNSPMSPDARNCRFREICFEGDK